LPCDKGNQARRLEGAADGRIACQDKDAGVYKRGSRYVVTYHDVDGAQRKESAATYELARQIKREREAEVAAGASNATGRVPLADYALEWIDRYQGRGRRGFREITRDQYRGDLIRYVLPYFAGPTPPL